MKKLIAGNWKMNCSLDEAKGLIADIINGIHQNTALKETCEFLVCPPFIYLPTIRHASLNHDLLSFGAQDCSHQDNGAYTGDISASMLSESECQYVICGHSERREYHKESDAIVKAKAQKIIDHKMSAIICVGESETQREFGHEIKTVLGQVEACLPEGATAANVVIAYEPIWAIGTGKTASNEDILEMHGAIREKLKEMLADGANIRILYGGSVKPNNAGDILNLDNVDGALIGGASLKAEDYLGIAQAI
ncbi:MAG: triose-phosphate isomerase [Alphaproteobacteria bacterium]